MWVELGVVGWTQSVVVVTEVDMGSLGSTLI